jgi:hypothetical protein
MRYAQAVRGIRSRGILPAAIIAFCMAALASASGWAQTEAEKAATNPAAKKISLEYQSVFQFDYADEEKTGYVGMFQPIIPFTLGPINFINRPILPIIALPEAPLDDDGQIPGLPFPPVGRPGENVKKWLGRHHIPAFYVTG